MGLSEENKFLIVKTGVVLNNQLDAIIYKLDKSFEGHTAYVTSGIRTPEKQLSIIKDYLHKKGIADEFIEKATVKSKVTYAGEEIYSWQLGWSKLLNAGVIINPPLKAKVLLDYINRSGVNRKGSDINPSIHFLGRAFDIGGGANSIEDEKQIIIGAIKSGLYPEILSFVPERENNCLHINIV